jgi:hypothetical protein
MGCMGITYRGQLAPVWWMIIVAVAFGALGTYCGTHPDSKIAQKMNRAGRYNSAGRRNYT